MSEVKMPRHEITERAKRDRRRGKSPSTQAGEFVKEEIRHVRQGKHGARSSKQAIAIGLSKARRAGVRLRPPKAGTTPARTVRSAKRNLAVGAHPHSASRTRSRAITVALKREGRGSASKGALAKQARLAASKRGASARSAAARRAVKTKGAAARSAAAKQAARASQRPAINAAPQQHLNGTWTRSANQ
jgi:hypothetical protein